MNDNYRNNDHLYMLSVTCYCTAFTFSYSRKIQYFNY